MFQYDSKNGARAERDGGWTCFSIRLSGVNINMCSRGLSRPLLLIRHSPALSRILSTGATTTFTKTSQRMLECTEACSFEMNSTKANPKYSETIETDPGQENSPQRSYPVGLLSALVSRFVGADAPSIITSKPKPPPKPQPDPPPGQPRPIPTVALAHVHIS